MRSIPGPIGASVALLILLLLSTLPGGAAALEAESSHSAGPLEGRHGLSLHGGFLNRISVKNDVIDGAVTSEARDTGTLASLSYAYWVGPEWNVGLSLGFIDAGTRASVVAGEVSSEAAAVASVLFGAAYYPEALAISPALRPYGSVALGPYRGSATNSRVGESVTNESISDSALGLRLQAGADLFFGKRFKAGVALGYAFVGDFDEQIGSHRNYSGPEFLAGIGILLGRGHERLALR